MNSSATRPKTCAPETSDPVPTELPDARPISAESRVLTLDGLRGCAVLLILVHHGVALSPLLESPVGTLRSYVRASLGLTFSGVDLFFVLSGFLIGGILLDHLNSIRSLPTFYVRRALRILPLAWLNIGLILFLHDIDVIHTVDAPAPWWVYGGFLTNFHLALNHGWTFGPLTPHWSLSIEEQFYLVFPFFLRLWPRQFMAWLGPGLIATALASRLAVCLVTPDNLFATHVLPFCRLDSLGAGFTCAWLVRSTLWPRLMAARHWLWFALLPTTASLAILLKDQYRAPEMLNTWGYTALALFYAIVLLLVYQPKERWLAACFTAGWLRLYGRYSYFIYLFQGGLSVGLVALLFHGHWHTDLVLAPWEIAAVPVVLLAPAALSWHFLESPLLRLGHRMKYTRP